MAFVGPNNAIAWAHFRLRGGWARSVGVTAAAMVLLACAIVMSQRLNPNDGGRTLFGWTTGLLVLQAAVLVLYIPGRIGAIVRGDVQSKMIESHRLMPMPPMHAVAGYIAGAATQPLVFGGGLFVLGALVAGAAGVDLTRWTFANAVLLAFAAFGWVVVAFASLGGRVGGGIIVGAIMIPYLTQGMALSLLPGVTVILSPVSGVSVFDLRVTGVTLPATYAISFAAQVFFGTICFIGAARAYRSTVEITIDTMLGLCFLLGWAAVSCAGLRAWEDFRPRGFRLSDLDTNVRIVASIIGGMLVAIGPVAANAMERVRWRRSRVLADPYPVRRPIPIAAVIAIAVLTLLSIPFAPPDVPTPPRDLLIRTAAVIVVALVALYFLFDLVYAFTNRAAGLALIWIALAWVAPIAVDWVRYSLADYGEGEHFAGFSACSPAGALIILWTNGVVDTTPGIGVQILIALVPIIIWLTTYERRRR